MTLSRQESDTRMVRRVAAGSVIRLHKLGDQDGFLLGARLYRVRSRGLRNSGVVGAWFARFTGCLNVSPLAKHICHCLRVPGEECSSSMAWRRGSLTIESGAEAGQRDERGGGCVMAVAISLVASQPQLPSACPNVISASIEPSGRRAVPAWARWARRRQPSTGAARSGPRRYLETAEAVTRAERCRAIDGVRIRYKKQDARAS